MKKQVYSSIFLTMNHPLRNLFGKSPHMDSPLKVKKKLEKFIKGQNHSLGGSLGHHGNT